MTQNLFESIPDEVSDEIFDLIIENDKVKIERIISKGHTSPESGWYDQECNEWVIVLKGEAKILIENKGEKYLIPGSYINIPAHQKHKVTWTKENTETIWLAIHY